MRFTADVGALFRRQGGECCSDDLGMMDTPRALVAYTESVPSYLGG